MGKSLPSVCNYYVWSNEDELSLQATTYFNSTFFLAYLEYGKFARKLELSASYAVHGEGFKMFKTIAATQYETVLAMVNLAIINCQLFGRNALNLKVS